MDHNNNDSDKSKQSVKGQLTPSQVPVLSGQERLSLTIDSLPYNPARDKYGIEDNNLQAICFVSMRAMEEAVRQKNYSMASNTIGAWLITVGEHLNTLGMDRKISAMFAKDLVEDVPILINIIQMVCDSMRPWVQYSQDAEGFCRNVICRPTTHPKIASCFLPLVPASLAEPWVQLIYDEVIQNNSENVKVSLLHALQDGLIDIYQNNLPLIGARRVAYNKITKRLSGYHLQLTEPRKKENRILFLVNQIEDFDDSPCNHIKTILKHWAEIDPASQLQIPEVAIFETGDGLPSKDQLGFYSYPATSNSASIGYKLALRKQVTMARIWDIEKNFDSSMREFMSAVYNYNPALVIAVDLPCSAVKGSLKFNYPVIDWINNDGFLLSMGHHILATAQDKKAEQALKLADYARLEPESILPLPTDDKECALTLLLALSATL